MSDLSHRQHGFSVSRLAADRPAASDKQADVPFLRRVLFGLIAATIFSGAVGFGLITQNEVIDGMQVASTHGPA